MIVVPTRLVQPSHVAYGCVKHEAKAGLPSKRRTAFHGALRAALVSEVDTIHMVVVAIDEARNFELFFKCLAPGSLGDGIPILRPLSISLNHVYSSIYRRHKEDNIIVLPCKLNHLRVLICDFGVKRTPG